MKKLIGFIVLLSVCNGCSSNQKSVETPPNIIFFLIDDIGIISTPPYGGSGVKDGDHIIPLETPNIDTFATNAMKFTHVYATPSCAPSRAQLMTGHYPFQTEMVWPAYPSDHFLADSEVTIANILADQGYRTAFGGKWNLRYGCGAETAERSPCSDTLQANQKTHLVNHGFQEAPDSAIFIGHTLDYLPPHLSSGTTFEEKYFPYNLNLWAQTFITDSVNKKQSFYLQYSFGSIHDSNDRNQGTPPYFPNTPTPLDTTTRNSNKIFADRIQYVDQMIGNILTLIDSLYIDDNTLVIITGDNGTQNTYFSRYTPPGASDTLLQGAKLTLESRGSRVPFMVQWPSVITSRSDNSTLIDFTDVFSTLVEAGGGTLPTNIHGTSFLAQLKGSTPAGTMIRSAVYSQMKSSQFVANKSYQLRYTAGEIANPVLYDISHSPLPDRLIGQPPFNNQADSTAYNMLSDFYTTLEVPDPSAQPGWIGRGCGCEE